VATLTGQNSSSRKCSHLQETAISAEVLIAKSGHRMASATKTHDAQVDNMCLANEGPNSKMKVTKTTFFEVSEELQVS
jgi:hypothetical protein